MKLRVLAHNYPETPGEAVKGYWDLHPGDSAVLMVAGESDLKAIAMGEAVRAYWDLHPGDFLGAHGGW